MSISLLKLLMKMCVNSSVILTFKSSLVTCFSSMFLTFNLTLEGLIVFCLTTYFSSPIFKIFCLLGAAKAFLGPLSGPPPLLPNSLGGSPPLRDGGPPLLSEPLEDILSSENLLGIGPLALSFYWKISSVKMNWISCVSISRIYTCYPNQWL